LGNLAAAAPAHPQVLLNRGQRALQQAAARLALKLFREAALARLAPAVRPGCRRSGSRSATCTG
jgi:hypothetical protein